MKTFTTHFIGLLFSAGLILTGCGGGSDTQAPAPPTPSSTIVNETSFDDGTMQGWTADGLWHITDTQASNGAYSAWYADPTSGTFETFDTAEPPSNTANGGALTSPSLTLGNNPTLDFDYQLINECEATAENFFCDFDALTVEISTDDGVTFTPLAILPQTIDGFKNFKVDLYGYAGQTVRIRFYFDTYDDVANNYAGAIVDHIVVADHVNLVTDSFQLTLADNLEGTHLASIAVPLHFSFPFQGMEYSTTSMDINGYLDFGGSVSEGTPNPTAFMNGLPRIAVLWDHLYPYNGGLITYRRTSSAIVVSLAGVKSGSSDNFPNDLVATLNDDGSIEIAYDTVNATTALAGITPGGGAIDPGETDLSANQSQSATGVVYEYFTGGSDSVDLSDTTLTFSN